MTEEMKAFSEYANVFQIDEVTEGLRIQFIDQEEFSMFKSGSHSLSSEAKEMISLFGSVLKDVPNNIAIMGHTDAVPFNRKDYSNWELSTDRANAARRAIVQSGVPQEKIVSVEGKAAQDLLYPTHPNAPENRRINFIILH